MAEARVHAHAVDDLLRVEPLHLRAKDNVVDAIDPQHVLNVIRHRGGVEELTFFMTVAEVPGLVEGGRSDRC